MPLPTILPNRYYRGLVTSEYQGPTGITSGILTLGSSILTSISNMEGVILGALVFGTGIPVGTSVIAINPSGVNSVALSNSVTDGYLPPTFDFDISGAGFDSGIWTSYSGTTKLYFFSAPSPKMQMWLESNLLLGKDLGLCLQQFASSFTLFSQDSTQQAVGIQLDILGNILGQSRSVPILTGTILGGGSSYAVGDVVTVVQGSASLGMKFRVTSVTGGVVTNLVMVAPGTGYNVGNATTTGGSGTGLTLALSFVVLSDNDYRTLLRCTVMKNHWNGQISNVSGQPLGTIQYLWNLLFNYQGSNQQSTIYFLDGGATVSYNTSSVMSATVYVGFGPYASSAISALTVNGYLVPRPQGVLYTISILQTPLFGFDLNSINVSGFDKGNWLAP